MKITVKRARTVEEAVARRATVEIQSRVAQQLAAWRRSFCECGHDRTNHGPYRGHCKLCLCARFKEQP